MLDLITGGFHVCGPEWRSGWRHESHTKLYVIRRGVGHYDCGAGERELRAGRIYLIPGQRRQRYRCSRRMELWWLHVLPTDQRLMSQLAAEPDLRSWSQARRSPTWRLLDGFFPERAWPSTLAITGLLSDLLSDLPAPATHAEQRLDGVADWLAGAATRNPPLSEIARQAALSPSQLSRVARREWGESPHARVLRLRLMHAQTLLRATELTVAAIARGCGYAGAPTFSKAFRRRHGEAPDAYRRRQGP